MMQMRTQKIVLKMLFFQSSENVCNATNDVILLQITNWSISSKNTNREGNRYFFDTGAESSFIKGTLM